MQAEMVPEIIFDGLIWSLSAGRKTTKEASLAYFLHGKQMDSIFSQHFFRIVKLRAHFCDSFHLPRGSNPYKKGSLWPYKKLLTQDYYVFMSIAKSVFLHTWEKLLDN